MAACSRSFFITQRTFEASLRYFEKVFSTAWRNGSKVSNYFRCVASFFVFFQSRSNMLCGAY